MFIRNETIADIVNIAAVIERAFGRADEARLVERLRNDGDAAISLVATSGDAVVGHVLLSPMSAPFHALGLAPLSVLPQWQRRGIGSALIEAAVQRARARECRAIFVLGDPDYYGRFGFRTDLAVGFSSPYAGPHFMVLPLGGALPVVRGRVEYAAAFANPNL